MRRRAGVLSIAAFLLAVAVPGPPQETPQDAFSPDFELVKTISHTGSAAWTDTGIEVKPGEEYGFEATGEVSLQKDNPVAVSGPEGLNLKSMQQPFPDRNLGCLIGMIVTKIEISVDKKTKEKVQRRLGETFYIGKRNTVSIPSAGRLLLGINENAVGDNDGRFEVSIYKKRADSAFRGFAEGHDEARLGSGF